MAEPSPVVIPPPALPGLVSGTAWFGGIVSASGGGACLLFGWLAGWGEGAVIGFCTFLPIVGIGAALVGLAWHFRRLRSEPLILEPAGRVLFRGKLLFESATKLIVRREVVDGENGPFETFTLVAETTGAAVAFPAPYFESFFSSAESTAVAGPIGAVLRIPVVCEG